MKETKFIFTLMLGCSLAAMAKAGTSYDNCVDAVGAANAANCMRIGTSGTYYALSGAANNQTMTIYGTTGEGSEAASVPGYAFLDSRLQSTLDSNIKSLKTSGSVNIGEYAFYYATGLTSVDLTGVQSIGMNAFYEATGLTSVDLTGVQSIGMSAFQNATGLTSVDLTGVQSIAMSAFKGATGLTSVDLTGVQTIGSGAFENTGLTSLVLPDSFFDESGNMKNSISKSALKGSGITNIYCPEGANCQNYFTTCPENTVDLGDCFDMSTFETVDRVPVTLNITPYTVENGQIKVGNRTYASLNDLANNNHIKKRIYTLKEANEVAGKVNRVSIKYR